MMQRQQRSCRWAAVKAGAVMAVAAAGTRAAAAAAMPLGLSLLRPQQLLTKRCRRSRLQMHRKLRLHAPIIITSYQPAPL